MIGWLNVASLFLGLIAWILPVVNLMQHKMDNHKNWIAFSIISLSACAISLCFQIFYNYHLVKIEDWSALLDTTYAVAFAAGTLVIITILLNSITFILYFDKRAK